ncbi:MAG TPA: DUF2314 domain-containing protein [Methylomirabilota bacterium]|nr:DUF2314 domain-containing protein [Methylomirabilota bacterium]
MSNDFESEEEESESPMLSLVWLLKSPRNLDVPTLKQIVEEAWGQEFSTSEVDPEELAAEGGSDEGAADEMLSDEDEEDMDDDENTNMIVGAPPVFMIHTKDQMFNLNSIPSPYFEEVDELAEATPDTRLRKVFVDHQAWISVDYLFALGLEEDADVDEDEIYEKIGKLMAELASDECLALLCPETEQIIPYTPEVAERLREPDPLAVFDELAQLPVVNVPDDHPRLLEAVSEARRRFPEFLKAFEKRYPGQQFAVKAPVTSEGTTEFIWVEVEGIGGRVIFGRLANDPVDLPGQKFGDRIEVEFESINDWLFTNGEEVSGLFTAKVLKEIAEGGEGPNN